MKQTSIDDLSLEQQLILNRFYNKKNIITFSNNYFSKDDNGNVNDKLFSILINKGFLSKCEHVDIRNNVCFSSPFIISDDGLAYLSKIPKLNTVGLSKNITDNGLIHLKEIKTLKNINLTETKTSDKGIKHLTKLPLEIISLSYNTTNNALIHLVKIKTLKHINTTNAKMSDNAKQYIRCLVAYRKGLKTKEIKEYLDHYENVHSDVKKARLISDLETKEILKKDVYKEVKKVFLSINDKKLKTKELAIKLFNSVARVALKENTAWSVKIDSNNDYNVEYIRARRRYSLFGRKQAVLNVNLNGIIESLTL